MKPLFKSFFIAASLLLLPIAWLIVEGQPHSFLSQVFLVNYTFLGDSFLILGVIGILFYKKNLLKAKPLLLSFLLTTVIIQVIKNFIFNDGLHLFFEEGEYVSSGSIFNLSGMPSSHMAFAVALFTLLAFYFSEKKWTILIIAAVFLMGYSRFYLAGNNLIDIVTGSVTGCLSSLLSYSIFFPAGKRKLARRTWEKPVTIG